jgi:methionine transaminase
MKLQLNDSKLPHTGTNIFTEMSALALQHQAINLGQGFADYEMNSQLCNLVHKHMLAGANQYSPMAGLPALRQAIAQKVNNLYTHACNWESDITITPGGTYAIYTALTTLLKEGDEAIILEPAYDSYAPNILLNKAIPVFVPLNTPSFSVDWNKVANAVSARTRVIIINTPHNPGSYIFTEQDWESLYQIIQDKNIFIVSDEVYEHIVLDAAQHLSILKYPHLAERAIAVFSFGKVYHNTGWKLGYAIAPPFIMNEFRKIHQYLAFTCNTPAQAAIAEFMEQTEEYLQLPQFFERKRDLFLNAMNQSRFTLHAKAQGSFFQTLGYENISAEHDKDFAKRITKEIGVAAIPLSPFYHNETNSHLLRFCFAKKDETLLKAAERLVTL